MKKLWEKQLRNNKINNLISSLINNKINKINKQKIKNKI